MANTAFDHASALTLPGSTTNNGLVRWGDTSAGSFGNITGITSDGSNLTLLTRGEIRFSDADSTHYIALESPATVSTSYTMALPAAVPSANDYLKVTSYSGGAGVLEWASVSADTNTTYSTSWVDSSNDAILRLTPSTGSADDLTIVAGSGITLTPSGDNLTIAASAGATLSGSTDNTIVTVTGSNAMQGEANLTYTGNYLYLKGDADDATSSGIHWGTSADTTLGTLEYDTLNGQFRLMVNNTVDVITVTNSGMKVKGAGTVFSTVETTSTTSAVGFELKKAASSTGGTIANYWTMGSGNGSSGNKKYELGYTNHSSWRGFYFWASDAGGASSANTVWRIPENQMTIDANTTWDNNAFDLYDDAKVLERAFSPTQRDTVYQDGKAILKGNYEELIEMGVLKKYPDDWVGYNDQRMAALLAGGIYQTRHRLDDSYEELKAEIKELNAKIDALGS